MSVEVEFHYVLSCPCGQSLSAPTEDEIVERSFAHLRDRHPDLVGVYEREHVLATARRLVRSTAAG